MRILLTGGAGYIGSHTALSLMDAQHEPIILDNFCRSLPSVIDRLSQIAGREVKAISGDIRDCDLVKSVLADNEIDAVIHFAALKSVSESVADPLLYYGNNITGLISLLAAMDAESVRTIVFSSSATVYGEPERLPLEEDCRTQAVNPYGQSKLISENILSSLVSAQRGWRISLLRYFNPVGAHPSGLIGEDPLGTPTNLMPLLTRVALGQLDYLSIFGTDYPSADGTAIRDYVHVVDLAEGHVSALAALGKGEQLQVYNLGTGLGTSVLELIHVFESETGSRVSHKAAPRRAGDVAALYASVEKAKRELGWSAKRGLSDMCLDSWRFASRFV